MALRSYLETMRREGRVAEAGAADRRVVERLAECRLSFGEHYDRSRNDALFASAFREYGIDVKVMDPAKAGELIGSRPIRDDLVGALDEWIYNQQEAGDQAGVARLLRVATAADPDPGRAGSGPRWPADCSPTCRGSPTRSTRTICRRSPPSGSPMGSGSSVTRPARSSSSDTCGCAIRGTSGSTWTSRIA